MYGFPKESFYLPTLHILEAEKIDLDWLIFAFISAPNSSQHLKIRIYQKKKKKKKNRAEQNILLMPL